MFQHGRHFEENPRKDSVHLAEGRQSEIVVDIMICNSYC